MYPGGPHPDRRCASCSSPSPSPRPPRPRAPWPSTAWTAADYHDAVARLQAGDTDVDCRAARLAYALTDGYEPYAVEPKKQERRLHEHLNERQDPRAALLVADSLLAGNYVNLDAHYGASLAHDQLGHADRAAFHIAVFRNLLDSIVETASGSADDPFVVNRVDEEYVVIAVLGFEHRGQSLVDCGASKCDLMTVRDPRDGAELELYFDVSIPYGHMRRQLRR